MLTHVALFAAALLDTTSAGKPSAPVDIDATWRRADPIVTVDQPRIPSPRELGRQRDDEPSDAYYFRLKVHRISSYAMLPLFALQYAAGAQLYDKGEDAADWAEAWHGVGAATIAGVFAINVVTGVPNVIEIWNEPRDRKRRLFHASTMLIAAAGFTATGIIADEAEDDASGRSLHRNVALGSMGVATIGYLSMLDLFRRD